MSIPCYYPLPISATLQQTFIYFSVISGPKNLQVIKTSTTSVIIQWEEAHGEIDRYVLSISPNQTDGSGKGSQEMRLPPGRDSAQIDGLEPGRLYDISLVAEKDGTRSLPANVQATPGEYWIKVNQSTFLIWHTTFSFRIVLYDGGFIPFSPKQIPSQQSQNFKLILNTTFNSTACKS